MSSKDRENCQERKWGQSAPRSLRRAVADCRTKRRQQFYELISSTVRTDVPNYLRYRRYLRPAHVSSVTKQKTTNRQQDIEGNDQVRQLSGRNLDDSTPLWQHDNPFLRVPARVVRAVSQACTKSKSVSSRLLSRLSFLAANYFYFAIVCLTASIIFWAISTPRAVI